MRGFCVEARRERGAPWFRCGSNSRRPRRPPLCWSRPRRHQCGLREHTPSDSRRGRRAAGRSEDLGVRAVAGRAHPDGCARALPPLPARGDRRLARGARAPRRPARPPDAVGGVMARRSYGTGSLTTRRDRNGRETWYGLMDGGRAAGEAPLGAEASARNERRSDAQAGRGGAAPPDGRGARRRWRASAAARSRRPAPLYVEHLEHVMRRKRTTLEDYRSYLRRAPRAVLRCASARPHPSGRGRALPAREDRGR